MIDLQYLSDGCCMYSNLFAYMDGDGDDVRCSIIHQTIRTGLPVKEYI